MKSKTFNMLVFAIIITIIPFKTHAQSTVNSSVSIESSLIEIRKENTWLREKNAELENRMAQIEKDLSQCCLNYQQAKESDRKQASDLNNSVFAKLEQNTPNPFKDKTVIRYYIPTKTSEAFIKIYSIFGNELLSFPLRERGLGQVEFSGKTLSAGIFTYILIIDGKAVDTKQMVLTR